MAPPKNRRLGFSRRAHFGLFIGYVIAVAAALLAVASVFIAFIISSQKRHQARLDLLRYAVERGMTLDVDLLNKIARADAVPLLAGRAAGRLVPERHDTGRLRRQRKPVDEVVAHERRLLARSQKLVVAAPALRVAFDHQHAVRQSLQ